MISRHACVSLLLVAGFVPAAAAGQAASPPPPRRTSEILIFPDSLEATFQKIRQVIPRIVMEPTTHFAFIPDTSKRKDGSFSVVHGDTLSMVPADSSRPRSRFVVTNDSVVRIEPLPRLMLDSLRADVLRLYVDSRRELQKFRNILHR